MSALAASPKNGERNLVTFRSYRTDDREWVMKSNLRFYRTFHDFDATFADALSAALDLLEAQLSNATSTYLIAESLQGPAGCIFFSSEMSTAGRIRLFYLEQAYRGQGIGARLLHDVLTKARKENFKLVRVSTFDRHPEACRLYESFGFAALTTSRSKAFGQVMRQVDYELSLSGGER